MKACPWCQSLDLNWTMLASKKFACMSCTNCNARGPLVPFELKHEPIDASTAPAITAWNTRPSAAPIGAEPGLLAAVFDEGLAAQAQRLGIAPILNETPGQHRDRVRRAAMLAAASSESTVR